jgi:hypothetical protein
MEIFRHILGMGLFCYGFLIILMYWIYWIRVVACKFGIGQVKFTSMAPFAGPIVLAVGALIYGAPLSQSLGWWVLLIDLNTYNFLISIPIAVWLNIRKSFVKTTR